MSKTRQQRKMRNRKKTIKRFKGGRKPTARRLALDCKYLVDLRKYFMSINFNDDITRLYNNSDDTLYNNLNRLQLLSPYAYIQRRGTPKQYLLENVALIVKFRDIVPKSILTDTIAKTIAEKDVELMNADIVFQCVWLLLFSNTSDYDAASVFKADIRTLLTAIPPVTIMNYKWKGLYSAVITHFDYNTLESLILGGHVPATFEEYNNQLKNLEERLSMHSKDIDYKSEYSQERMERFVEMFKVLKPRSVYNATNILYSMKGVGHHMQPDDVEDLYSYLDADTENGDDEGDY